MIVEHGVRVGRVASRMIGLARHARADAQLEQPEVRAIGAGIELHAEAPSVRRCRNSHPVVRRWLLAGGGARQEHCEGSRDRGHGSLQSHSAHRQGEGVTAARPHNLRSEERVTTRT